MCTTSTINIDASSNKVIAAFIEKKEAEVANFIAQVEANQIALENAKLALRNKKAEEKEKLAILGIKLEEISRTYSGQTGCACGCGGDYTDTGDTTSAAVTKRLNKINKGILEGRAEFFGNGVEVANESYTRCVRIYFVDGIYKNKAGE